MQSKFLNNSNLLCSIVHLWEYLYIQVYFSRTGWDLEDDSPEEIPRQLGPSIMSALIMYSPSIDTGLERPFQEFPVLKCQPRGNAMTVWRQQPLKERKKRKHVEIMHGDKKRMPEHLLIQQACPSALSVYLNRKNKRKNHKLSREAITWRGLPSHH